MLRKRKHRSGVVEIGNPHAPKRVVEVSPNLVDWFSGDNHTTTVVDNGRIPIIRDNTPITPAAKRFIRARAR